MFPAYSLVKETSKNKTIKSCSNSMKEISAFIIKTWNSFRSLIIGADNWTERESSHNYIWPNNSSNFYESDFLFSYLGISNKMGQSDQFIIYWPKNYWSGLKFFRSNVTVYLLVFRSIFNFHHFKWFDFN